MLLHPIDLTTALRPSLLAEETLLFVQDSVGLYEGKFKLADYQNGQAYLTSHRACYIDNEEPRKKAVAILLKDVDRDRCELFARFLKSSPKITLYPKAAKHLSLSSRPSFTGSGTPSSGHSQTRGNDGYRQAPTIPPNATWICPICSFSNPIASNFDPTVANEHTPIPPCLACGIAPPYLHVVKAAIASISNRQQGSDLDDPRSGLRSMTSTPRPEPESITNTGFPCPRCTFQNHPSLLSCEICGASLISNSAQLAISTPGTLGRTDSPAPAVSETSHTFDPMESVKLSFRAGGEKIFYERLKGALVQRKWLLQSAPPIPKMSVAGGLNGNRSQTPPIHKNIGIAGLERRDQELRKNNEIVIGNAFEDLSALMASAKEIIALAEALASQTRSATATPDSGNPSISSPSQTTEATALLSQLNLTTTRDMLGGGGTGANSLYLTELSRQLAEFLTDDATGVLKHEGGIISLVDLWAVFNRARGGVELVSPTDFNDAAMLFDKLKLPVRLRKFRSGLLVVQGRDRTDEKTVRTLLAWLAERRAVPPERPPIWDWVQWGGGVTALDVAERFGWSVGVATEELEMAEEQGALCREVGVEGVRFWENMFIEPPQGLVRPASMMLSRSMT